MAALGTKASFKAGISVYENGRRAPEWNLTSDLNGQQSLGDFLVFTKVSLLEIAFEALREEQAQGFDKAPLVEVDGRSGKNELQVSPLGKIHYIARQEGSDMIDFAYTAILDKSPILTGAYASSHIVLYNFKPVAANPETLRQFLKTADFKDSDSVIILNTVPYARRLERLGITIDRQQSRKVTQKQKKNFVGPSPKINAANGVYYLTFRAVTRKFKRNIKVNFKFLPGHYFGSTVKTSGKFANQKKHKRTANSPQNYLYPCLFFTFKESGII